MESMMAEGKSVRTKVMESMKDSANALGRAQMLAMEANPMTADVAVFQRMAAMQKELGGMMLEVSKLRGLE